jgi:hypothetical protein
MRIAVFLPRDAWVRGVDSMEQNNHVREELVRNQDVSEGNYLSPFIIIYIQFPERVVRHIRIMI